MTNADIKVGFNQVISKVEDPNTIAKLEVLREYFSNPEFKAKLEEYTYKINS